jgi:hypothetical protein
MHDLNEEWLGPLPNDCRNIAVCPLCAGKAWSACGCGWAQWSPSTDPDELRSLDDVREYCKLIMCADFDAAQTWLGLLAIGVDGHTLEVALARCDWSESHVEADFAERVGK